MFVYNVKINKKKFVKIFTCAVVVLAVILLCLSLSKIFSSGNKLKSNDPKVLNVTSNNFTNFLKDCHNDIDKYVGTNVNIIGYVYRMPDFSDNQFVLARTMLMSSNNKAVVVGILCESNQAKNLKNNSWVTCEGIIEKGDYHGEMPVLNVKEITNCEIPEDEFVRSPQD